jgi:hypothetical protein
MALEPVSGSAGSFAENGKIGSKMNNIGVKIPVWYPSFLVGANGISAFLHCSIVVYE